jgi:hypothetical protein
MYGAGLCPHFTGIVEAKVREQLRLGVKVWIGSTEIRKGDDVDIVIQRAEAAIRFCRVQGGSRVMVVKEQK